MWINRIPLPIIFGGNMSVQMKPRFIGGKMSNEDQVHRHELITKNQLRKLILLAESHCRTWTAYNRLVRPKFKQLRRFGCKRFRDAGLLWLPWCVVAGLLCKASQWFPWCVAAGLLCKASQWFPLCVAAALLCKAFQWFPWCVVT
jgi:hypothetical protein